MSGNDRNGVLLNGTASVLARPVEARNIDWRDNMFSKHPIEVLWEQSPEEIKLELALNLITAILKISEGRRAEIVLDDGRYEIKLNKLD
nr:MAG TPA: hypothetical protein [Caudoviricetes sp.]